VRCLTSDLTTHLGGELVGPDVSIEGASIDSRTIRPGQLYAPIVAERDGHAFIPAALEAGASAYAKATGHFEEALRMNTRMGTRPWVAQAQREYARMLVERAGPCDRNRANQLLGEAITTYRELGMEPWATQAATLVE